MRITKATFVVCMSGQDETTHDTFQDAFAAFFTAIKSLLSRGTSWQVLETCCWIEGKFEIEGQPPVESAMLFYDAKDFAYAVGILGTSEPDGKVVLANPLPNISATVAYEQYRHVAFEVARERLTDLAEQIKATAEEFRPQ